MSGRPGGHPPLLPDKLRGAFRAVVVTVIDYNWEGRHRGFRELDMLFQAGRDVHGNLSEGECLVAGELSGGTQRPEVRRRTERGDVVRPDREEARLDRETQRQLRDCGGGGPLGPGLPGCHRRRTLPDRGGKIAFAEACELTGQRKTTTVEEGGRLGHPTGCWRTHAHCSPLARSRRSSSAGRRRRTSASATVLGPAGSGLSSSMW